MENNNRYRSSIIKREVIIFKCSYIRQLSNKAFEMYTSRRGKFEISFSASLSSVRLTGKKISGESKLLVHNWQYAIT